MSSTPLHDLSAETTYDRFGRWLRNRPQPLERVYRLTHDLIQRADPLIRRLGYERADRWLRRPEAWAKRLAFDCQMCGQCVLHSTGMTCPMSCPKNLRNGPCGGVRANGHCEVYPDRPCVWVEAYERSQEMPLFGHELNWIQPPVNRQLEGSSAWINMLSGVDEETPSGWGEQVHIPLHVR